MNIMKKFPYEVTIVIEKERFSELLKWLNGQHHTLRETMSFGKNHHKTGDDFVTQQVLFKDKSQAAMFKLAWG